MTIKTTQGGEKVNNQDKIQVFIERAKTGKIDKIEISGKKFRHDPEYKKQTVKKLIAELYKKIYRGEKERT